MAKPLPPERPRSRRACSLSPRERGAQRRRHGPAGRRGSCQLDPSCERVGEWGAGRRSTRKRRLARRRRALPNALQLPLRARVLRPCTPHGCHSGTGLRSAARLQVGALRAGSERAPRSALYNPATGKSPRQPRHRPSLRQASPPPGAPRPRPSPPPASRPQSRAGYPLSHGRGHNLSYPRTSLRSSRLLPWGVPASACRCRQSAEPRPSSSGRPVPAAPWLATFR